MELNLKKSNLTKVLLIIIPIIVITLIGIELSPQDTKEYEGIVEKEQGSISEKTDSSEIIPSNLNLKSEFDIKKEKILSNLTRLDSSSFSILFDADKSSNGNQLHVYKLIHDKDGWIGDVSFYYGESDSTWHKSKFDNIFKVKIFLSNENGVVPTSASKPIIKDILKEFDKETRSLGISEPSEWIESTIISGKDVGGGERKETLSNDDLEISFASYEINIGFYELIIIEKIN